MKKRILGILLSLCMVLMLFPVTAFAEGDDTAELQALLDAGGTVTLDKDYTFTSKLQVNNTVTLDLNGYTLTSLCSDYFAIYVGGSGLLTLTDSSAAKTGRFTNEGTAGMGIYVDGSLVMEGGHIDGFPIYCVNAEYTSTFTMTGGKLTGAADGFALCVSGGAGSNYAYKPTMYADGGTVVGGTLLHNCTVTKSPDAALETVFNGEVSIVGKGDKQAKIRCGVFCGAVSNGGELTGGIFYGGLTHIYGDDVDGDGKLGENAHTITFMNGEAQYAIEVLDSEATSYAPVTPTKTGYTFAGWYTDEALTDPYEFGSTLPESINLYAGFKPVTYTVEYDGGAEFGLMVNFKTHGVDLTLAGKTFYRDGYVQSGWTDANGGFYALGGTYSTDADVTLYPAWDKIVTLTVPFTITVTLGDNGVPGETAFTLEIVDANAGEETCADVTVSAAVTTNGAGSYTGTMTLTGPYGQLRNMLCEGAFVQQVNGGADGWAYDDTVWGLLLTEIAAYASADDAAQEYTVLILPATCEETENGMYYELDWNANPLNQMSFTNVYTAHDHAYTQKYNETDHWEECACGDERNKEAHRYGEWTVTKEATETEAGAKERTCTVCGYQETAEIPQLPVNPVTGDNSNLVLWLALLALSAAGMIGTALYSKRRRSTQA
ncbi:MAG: InlB B-repeat-containing protein [Faecousia sp.]